MIDVIIVIAVVLFVGGLVTWGIVRKIKGKGGGCCDCSQCSSSSHCGGAKHKVNKESTDTNSKLQ